MRNCRNTNPASASAAVAAGGKRRYVPLKSAAKRMQKHMALLLSLPVRDQQRLEKLRALGVADEDATGSMLLCAALFERAAASGDISAFREIRSILTAGQNDTSGAQDREQGQLASLIRGLQDDA